MTVQSEMLGMLRTVAGALGADLRVRLVFVGGCTSVLFITDEATLETLRATEDVDLIVDLAGYSDWTELQATLRKRGFSEAHDDTVTCRMRLGGLKVDFMPDDASILGFTNRWYAEGIATAVTFSLTETLNIRHLTPQLFIATKLEAYLGRGEGDLLASRDMEDILQVIEGRPAIVEEVRRANHNVRQFIAEQFTSLLRAADFEYFLEGNIRGGPEDRLHVVSDRFIALSAAGG